MIIIEYIGNTWHSLCKSWEWEVDKDTEKITFEAV